LKDGPKTTAELLREVPCIVHSRIAELRDRGLDIVCERIPGEGASAYKYTLVSLGDGAADRLGPDGAPSPSASGVDAVLPSRRSAPQRQLQIWEAA
jgi:hypothetical protein